MNAKKPETSLSVLVSDIGRIFPEVEPILKSIQRPPPGPWKPAELYPWICLVLAAILKASMLIGLLLLKAVIEEYISGIDRQVNLPARGAQAGEKGAPRPCPCPRCGCTNWSYKGKKRKKKDFRSVFGTLTLQRFPALCPRCGAWFYPLDVILGLDAGKLFPDLQKLVIVLGAYLPFRCASELLLMTTGQLVAPGTIRRSVYGLGEYLVGRMKNNWELELSILKAAYRKAKEVLTLEIFLDGGMVPMNKKPKEEDGSHKEARAACIRLRDRAGKTVAKLMFCRLTDLSEFLQALARLLDECRETLPLKKVLLCGDGAKWIWDWGDLQGIALHVLDWFHLFEKALEFRAILKQPVSPGRRKRVDKVIDALWEGRSDDATRLLRELRCKSRAERKPKKDLLRYIKNNKGRIPNYKWRRERKLTIGSGAIEGGQKFVISNRLKCSGMRWTEQGADFMMLARCAVINGTWETDVIHANLYGIAC